VRQPPRKGGTWVNARGPEVSSGGTDRLAGGGGGDLAIVDRIDTTRNCERIRR
jgi:hypothetical protein